MNESNKGFSGRRLEFASMCETKSQGLLICHLLRVCRSWERDPLSVALPEVSLTYSLLKVFSGGELN